MADIDDFEMIDETGLSNEQVFEIIDVNDDTKKNTNINTPTTHDTVLPLLVPKPLVDETSQIVQQRTPSPIVNPPEPEESHSPIQITTTLTEFIPIKQTIVLPPPPPRVFVPVPSLPKAPPLQRYGNAALIPHNLNETLNIDTVINKARENHQDILNLSTKQQQDVQTVLEQRRKLLNKK